MDILHCNLQNIINYKQIIAFEPDPDNFKKCVESLSKLRNKSLEYGASNAKSVLNISKDGSQSCINVRFVSN